MRLFSYCTSYKTLQGYPIIAICSPMNNPPDKDRGDSHLSIPIPILRLSVPHPGVPRLRPWLRRGRAPGWLPMTTPRLGAKRVCVDACKLGLRVGVWCVWCVWATERHYRWLRLCIMTPMATNDDFGFLGPPVLASRRWWWVVARDNGQHNIHNGGSHSRSCEYCTITINVYVHDLPSLTPSTSTSKLPHQAIQTPSPTPLNKSLNSPLPSTPPFPFPISTKIP